jgi:dTDP-L-rhamnose 4-epimerase
MNKVLVTGGAGFIGSHLVDKFVKEGLEVVVLDNLIEQIHPDGKLPSYFNSKATFIHGDVENVKDWEKALKDVDAVYHYAAAVGVGQSMYEIAHYVKTNSYGTSLLLDYLVNQKHQIKKVVIAASMSSYGEGAYVCKSHGRVRPGLRPDSQMEKHEWEPVCPKCHRQVTMTAITEEDLTEANSIYAISKKNQEEMILNICSTYEIPAVAFRYFNAYGERQSISNPYNGVAAIFISQLKNDAQPIIFEDGNQTRDFVNVHDIADINFKVLSTNAADFQFFNVGTGNPIKVKDVAEVVAKLMGKDIHPKITSSFRKKDVRHCFADMTKIKKVLGWQPSIKFENGIKDVIEWSKNEKALNMTPMATEKLREKGLIK